MGQTFSTTIIDSKARHIGPYPFGLFRVLPDGTYKQNITSKAFNSLGYSYIYVVIETMNVFRHFTLDFSILYLLLMSIGLNNEK
jgi:hypothetical protein